MSSGHDPTEQILLAALSRGDESALRQIFDRYYPILLGNVYRIIPDEDACQDLVQEVLHLRLLAQTHQPGHSYVPAGLPPSSRRQPRAQLPENPTPYTIAGTRRLGGNC